MNLLFICSANVNRSLTAHHLFQHRFNCDSAATIKGLPNTVTQLQVDSADIIFCMEKHHKDTINKIVDTKNKQIIVLGIHDIYNYGSPELVDVLEKKVTQFL